MRATPSDASLPSPDPEDVRRSPACAVRCGSAGTRGVGGAWGRGGGGRWPSGGENSNPQGLTDGRRGDRLPDGRVEKVSLKKGALGRVNVPHAAPPRPP